MIFKILGLFVNPLTADNYYSLLIRDKLYQPFQIQLSQKRKIISDFFLTFSKFKFIFGYFQKKDDSNS